MYSVLDVASTILGSKSWYVGGMPSVQSARELVFIIAWLASSFISFIWNLASRPQKRRQWEDNCFQGKVIFTKKTSPSSPPKKLHFFLTQIANAYWLAHIFSRSQIKTPVSIKVSSSIGRKERLSRGSRLWRVCQVRWQPIPSSLHPTQPTPHPLNWPNNWVDIPPSLPSTWWIFLLSSLLP